MMPPPTTTTLALSGRDGLVAAQEDSPEPLALPDAPADAAAAATEEEENLAATRLLFRVKAGTAALIRDDSGFASSFSGRRPARESSRRHIAGQAIVAPPKIRQPPPRLLKRS
jgi:hypothetical protein